MHKCITPRIDPSQPDLFTTLRSPSHIDLSQFKITIVTSLQWEIKHFQVWGLLPMPIPPVCVLPLACDPCPITLCAEPF
jgi:hypothetical protein